MATANERNHSRTESESHDFYLPGTSISSAFDRAGSIVGKFLGRHGVVLIPDTYNR